MITVTSFYFFVLLVLGVILYYFLPKKIQWIVLLGCSVAYYFLAATSYTILYLIFSTAIAYVSTIFIERRNRQGADNRLALGISLVAIVLNIVVWFLFKGSSFWVSGSIIMNRYFSQIPVLKPVSLASALGMGYYTAQVMGYILDVYWNNTKPQYNPLKLFLFVMPQSNPLPPDCLKNWIIVQQKKSKMIRAIK